MRLHNRKELYDYLNSVDWGAKRYTELSSVYFLVRYDGHVEPVYFAPFEEVYFETPCDLQRFPLKEEELREYVQVMYDPEHEEAAYEHEKSMQRGEWHYEIQCWQCSPFLPDEVEILAVLSEPECLDWLLGNG